MKLLLDFLPIVVFFIAYYLHEGQDQPLFFATQATMVAVLVQMCCQWLWQRKIERLHLISLVLVLVLGGATLLTEDKRFFLWKPTVVYWAFALVFLASEWIGDKNLACRIMGHAITLPKSIWQKLNRAWWLFFAFLGVLNLCVAFLLPEPIWVNFKLFGILGLLIAFGFLQTLFLGRYLASSRSVDD